MKFITKNTDYAVRAIVYLAKNPRRFVSSKEISLSQTIPLQYLRRILRVLMSKGIVLSKEGISGGARLLFKPKDINVVDLMSIFQGDIQISECMFRKKVCARRPSCILRKKINKIRDNVIKEFEGITIDSLIRD